MEYKYFLLMFVLVFLAIPFIASAGIEHQYQKPEFTPEIAAFAILYFGIVAWVIFY